MSRKPIDDLTGFDVGPDFERFSQRDDIFCRALWDESVKSRRSKEFFGGYFMPRARSRRSEGFSQRDYALRNASWHVTNVLRDSHRQETGRKEGFFDYFTAHEAGWPEPYAFDSPEQATRDLEKVARFAGADLFGVCAGDERWMYRELFDDRMGTGKPAEVPGDLPHVIVIGESMDLDLTRTVPSALSGSATGMGYSNDSVTLLTLAQYIRNLGYRAYASMNDTALAVPLAVQAGLGEAGRHSLLITREFGPRLRLGKVFTDLPLVNSRPQQFGVNRFCDICDRCVTACPPKAIAAGAPSNHRHNRSNLKGVSKWTTNAETCFKFWVNQNSDCSICIRVCPYNRDYRRRANRLWRWLAGTRLRRLALWLDDRLVDRRRQKASWWWDRP